MFNKKNIIYATIYVAFLLGLAVAGYLIGDHYGFSRAKMNAHNGTNFASDVSFYDLPRMNLTLSSLDGGKSGKVRIDMSLEISKKDLERMHDYQPRMCDRLVTFIRQQDIETLRNPRNQKVFHEELLQEANKVTSPIPIIDVVLRQMVFM